jgi:hypothetical protein
MTDSTAEEDAPLSASAALTMLNNQQRSIANQLGSFAALISASWGIAWFLGFLALWLIDGPRPGFGLPLPAAITIFVVLLAAAIAISATLGVRSGRGIRGSARAFTGTVYGVSWSASMIAISVLGGALEQNGMSRALANIFFPCAYTLVAGLLYLIAGGIWGSVSFIVAGGWIMLVAVIAPWFGYPTHFLVFAIGGGGGFLALAIYQASRTRGLRRSAASASAGVQRG